MHIILLSGGCGKRLWPLSNDTRSKQFLKLLTCENSLHRNISMIQRVWKQLQNAGLSECTTISTNKSQIDIINNQLGPNASLVVEPSRRNTYPAILLACSYLYSVKNINLDEVVVVVPVDSYVEDEFFHQLNTLDTVIENSHADLALIGITPTFPSEQYGYIIPDNYKNTKKTKNFIKITNFEEKPKYVRAKELLRKNAMWNSGVFAFKLKFLINHLKRKNLPLDFEEILAHYEYLPKNSFDYEIVEKTMDTVVVPYLGSWKDLGTWNNFTEEINTCLIGKGSISPDSKNIHVINELDIPVSVLSLSNIVVAVSPDGILVSDKEASQRVTEIAQDFEQRPMYEERRWGWYHVLNHSKYDDGKEVLTKKICVLANNNISYQKHLNRREIWTVINGTGWFVLNNTMQKIKPGDILKIPVNTFHAIKAITNLEIIEVQMGSKVVEEDILRINLTWEQIEQHCTKQTYN